MARPDFLSPLHLFAPMQPFAAAGAEQSPDPQLLLNPNKSAMLIDQFRFSGKQPATDQLAGWDFTYLGVDLRLGSVPITNGIVPVASLVPRYHGFALTPSNALITSGGYVDSSNNGMDSVMTWHLPRPLYVPPGVQLYCRFIRQNVFSVQNRTTTIANIGFSAVGRSMPIDYPIPKKIWIPWATATQCKTDLTRFVSKDQELANPNTELLHVTSLNGFNCARGTTPTLGGVPTPSPMTCQMTLSSGKMLMRDPTPFFSLFPADRGVLNLDATLQSKEFVRCELELTPPAGSEGTNVATLSYTTIGMIGFREVQTPIGVQP